MYTTCLFCQADLGRNEALEAFPVGRRLAYDAAKGRLWVVCRRCERWNLTPQEARWEALEQAERLYRGTRLRAATDNVGLARLKDGTELVRVGRPLRPEFAAWRYGDQFGRRRTRYLLGAGGLTVVAGAAVVAGPVLGLVGLGVVSPVLSIANAVARRNRQVVHVPVPNAESSLLVNREQLGRVRLTSDQQGGFQLRVVGRHREAKRSLATGFTGLRPASYDLTREDAVRAAAALLPAVNDRGGARGVVADAVDLLEGTAGSVDAFARIAEAGRRTRTAWSGAEAGSLRSLPPAARLALEMAAHEEQERRALDGELHELEQAWRRAEEIAAIADDLLLPDGVGAKLGALKARRDASLGER